MVLRNKPSSICSNNLMCFFNINLCSSDLSSISGLSEIMCWNLKVYTDLLFNLFIRICVVCLISFKHCSFQELLLKFASWISLQSMLVHCFTYASFGCVQQQWSTTKYCIQYLYIYSHQDALHCTLSNKSTWFHMFQSHLLQLSTTCWSHSKVYTSCISHHLDKWCTMTSSIIHPFGCLWLSMHFWALDGLLDTLDTFCFLLHASLATWRCSLWNCVLLRGSIFIATIHSTHNSTSKFNKTKQL